MERENIASWQYEGSIAAIEAGENFAGQKTLEKALDETDMPETDRGGIVLEEPGVIWQTDRLSEKCDRLYSPILPNTSVLSYQILPGIRLCLNRMGTTSVPMRQVERMGVIRINYGLRGRSEQTLTDGKVTFVAAGELAIAFRVSRGGFYFPSGVYDGVEWVIDLEAVRSDPAKTLISMGMDLEQLTVLYGGDGFYKAGHLPEMDTLMKQIWQIEGNGSRGEFAYLCIRTIELLRILLYEKIPELEYTNLSPAHVSYARAYHKMLTENLAERITASQAAAKFHISETSLKDYFRIVYGENVSSYMRRYRMETARQLLAEGKESIGEIAARVGFQGQNKFAAAFRSWAGVNPGEYRRQHTAAGK